MENEKQINFIEEASSLNQPFMSQLGCQQEYANKGDRDRRLNIFAAAPLLHYFSTFPTPFVVKHGKYVPDPGMRIHAFKIGGLVGILGTGLGHSHRTYFATWTGARCLSPSTCLNTYGICPV